jgi:hypothetical protein
VITVLAGGTGGARLARGLLDVVGPRELAVIANTGDDVEMYGVHVSPDPDLVAFTLADVIDDRGWGIAGDSFEVMDALERADRPAWFRLGDRDLAMCLVRTERLNAGERLTLAHAEVCHALGLDSQVIPMSDDPVRTQVKLDGDWLPFQEFMIAANGKQGAEIEDVEFVGMDEATPSPEAINAIEDSEVIVIGLGRAGGGRQPLRSWARDQGPDGGLLPVGGPPARHRVRIRGLRRPDRRSRGGHAGGRPAGARHGDADGFPRRPPPLGRRDPRICGHFAHMRPVRGRPSR